MLCTHPVTLRDQPRAMWSAFSRRPRSLLFYKHKKLAFPDVSSYYYIKTYKTCGSGWFKLLLYLKKKHMSCDKSNILLSAIKSPFLHACHALHSIIKCNYLFYSVVTFVLYYYVIKCEYLYYSVVMDSLLLC